jgi:hypothetical protein
MVRKIDTVTERMFDAKVESEIKDGLKLAEITANFNNRCEGCSNFANKLLQYYSYSRSADLYANPCIKNCCDS